ncbi:MAG: hypothetical protein EOP56_06710 [Sphingobacteriales bacterium]|nr:MAG: hypothetical protein EOP56_06710 [Sphingobacteriales bacterium]
MKFSIGDKVVLKRTGEEGTVVSYINKQMVEVEINGTTFPTYLDEVDHPYLKWFTEKKKPQKIKGDIEQMPVERIKERPQRLARGIYLSFIPVFKPNETEDIVDYFKVHLLNELPDDIQFSYDVKLLHQSEFRHEGKLHAFGNLYLHNVPFEDMNDQPRFHWQVAHTTNIEMQAEEGVVRIKPVKLFSQISEMLQKNEPSFSYMLMEDFRQKEKKKEERQQKRVVLEKPPASHFSKLLTDAPRYELDLHIEKLVSSIQGLSNADMLAIQLETLQKFLNIAISHKQDRMVIIHGLGKGVLKDEVHKMLKQTPQVKRFTNEWQGQYGFGATVVQFKH